MLTCAPAGRVFETLGVDSEGHFVVEKRKI